MQNFDADKWNAVCRDVVYRGNYAKFSQNENLKKILKLTGNKTIVEASPEDRIWGIGLGQNDLRALDPKELYRKKYRQAYGN